MLPDDGDVTGQTLELLWRAAPERVQELDQIFAAGVQTRLSRGQSPTLGVTYNVLKIPEVFLQQLWLMSHAAWYDLLEFDKLKADPNYTPQCSLVADALGAARYLSRGEVPEWPPRIAKFNEKQEGNHSKAVRELYAMSAAWAIAHEFKHALFYESAGRPNSRIEEEYLCDQYAADFLLARVADYSALMGEEASAVMGKRAMSCFVGLYAVARLSLETSGGSEHPPIRDRIKILFDRVGTEPAKHFWGFALALLWGLRREIATSTPPLQEPTPRDLAYFALDKAFENVTN